MDLRNNFYCSVDHAFTCCTYFIAVVNHHLGRTLFINVGVILALLMSTMNALCAVMIR